MHEIYFSDAVLPAPVRVLNLPLRRYSLGHELRLFAARNALRCLPRAEFDALPFDEQARAIRQAVLICCDPESYHAKLTRGSLFGFRQRWHALKCWLWRRTLKPWDYPVAIAEFRSYLEAAQSTFPGPDAKADVVCAETGGYTPMHELKGRAFGAPAIARLYTFVLEQIPEAELRHQTGCAAKEIPNAWDFPLCLAEKLYATVQESRGNLRIENFSEYEEKIDHAQYVAELRAEEEKARGQKPEVRSQNAGLATSPPDLTSDLCPPSPGKGGAACPL